MCTGEPPIGYDDVVGLIVSQTAAICGLIGPMIVREVELEKIERVQLEIAQLEMELKYKRRERANGILWLLNVLNLVVVWSLFMPIEPIKGWLKALFL